ncbi:MAG: menaquinone biosynthesis decarboxylase [Ignavibacteriales bacterium]|nr:menaquinone biosynthesis decarboxylase [Ignavibacteriales bacterium]
MKFTALRELLEYLERCSELHRVKVEVDPELEITEIAVRALREGKPALLFENVKGSPYPLAINVYASARRLELALGKHPEQIGKELIAFAEQMMPPTLKSIVAQRSMVRRLITSRPKQVTIARSQEVVEQPNLSALPILKCWPDDGGRFLTLPQVLTYDPHTGHRNIGMYRMHVFDKRTTGMHWQIQKGGGFHYYQAEALHQPFEVAVALGTDPALLMATIAALPEGIDEAMFAGFLRGRGTRFVGGRSISINVPADAEFVLEGLIAPKERRMEGPFGDHFGHYSAASEFPVFHLKAVTHRKNPIYPATVVGRPPMEDKFLGDATQQILGPLVRTLHSEVRNLWAYYEAGFHNLLVVAIDERYEKEAMKTALGLMGTGQLSLTKCIVAVSPDVDVRNFTAVLHAIRENFDPHGDFMMLPKVPLDTLDFTSLTMNLGSKMVLDATKKKRTTRRTPVSRKLAPLLRRLPHHDRRILDAVLVEDALGIVKVEKDGSAIIRHLLTLPELEELPLLAAVSADVDIHDAESYIWGIFTRFDCERDVRFAQFRHIGISPIYSGTMGIDATWKRGYPDALKMDNKVAKKVEEKWDHYWR